MNEIPTIQYQGLTAPLMPPTPQSVGSGWMGSCLPPKRRTWAAALTVAACVWNPTIAEGTKNPPTGWRPTYVDQVHRKKALVAQRPAYFSRELVTQAAAADPGGSFISTGAVPLLQYQSLAAPFNEIVVSTFATQIPISFADVTRPLPGTHASRQQFFAFDRFAAPTAVILPDLSWATKYPDQLLRVRQTPLIASELYPTIAPQLDLYWRPRFPDQHLARPNVARYVWPHPHFIVEVDVPVMAWTGWYLDPPVRLKARQQPFGPSGPLNPSLLTEPTAPPSTSWVSQYPDRVRSRSRSLATLEQHQPTVPLFIPGQTNPVTALSWQGRYADRVPGLRRTADYPAFSFDRFTAPTPVVVPDQTIAVYPNKVWPKARATWAPDETWPNFVPDVSQAVTPLSWDATYPDRIWPQDSLLTAAQLALMIDARIAPPVIAASPAHGKNRVGIPQRNRTGSVIGYARVVFIPREKRGT